MFTPHAFDAVILEQQLHDALTPHRTLQRINTARNTLTLALDGIKSDMIRFDYPMLQPIQAVQNIRLYALPDIAAMKLSALAGRGAKKDFYDLHCLLQEYSLRECLSFFEAKFGSDTFHLRKSLVFFDDADTEPDPHLLENISWSTVKTHIRAAAATL